MGWHLSHDDLCDVQGDAEHAMRQARLDHEDVPSMSLLVTRTVGTKPRAWKAMATRGKLSRLRERWYVFHRSGLPGPILRFVLAHETGEFVYRDRGFTRDEKEARCNAFAAACVAPREHVQRAVKRHAHGVYALARELAVPQSVAVLRLGEVCDRPVVLLRDAGPIVRGASFAWPDVAELRKAVRVPPPNVHPLRITDSAADRWALMAVAA